MSAQLTLDHIEVEEARSSGRRDPAIAAREFVANNPEAYGNIVKWTARDVEEGNRCSMHLYLALLRRYHWIKRGGSPYRVDNRISRYLVDILLADHPEFSDGFERRNRDGDAAA